MIPANDDSAEQGNILVVREGPSANCSSIGSVVDTLFATAVVGGAVFAAIAAALAREDVTVVGASANSHAETDTDADADEDDDAASS
jgi:hypothetical protein